MSVSDRDVIDSIGIKNAEKIISLIIFDNLEWSILEYHVHMDILQDKINDYIEFLQNNGLKEKFPDKLEYEVEIIVYGKYELNEAGKIFFREADILLREKGVRLYFIHFPGSSPKKR